MGAPALRWEVVAGVRPRAKRQPAERSGGWFVKQTKYFPTRSHRVKKHVSNSSAVSKVKIPPVPRFRVDRRLRSPQNFNASRRPEQVGVPKNRNSLSSQQKKRQPKSNN